MSSMKKSISIKEKLNILEDIEKNMPSKEIFKKHGINKSTLYKIKQNKENIENFTTNSVVITKNIKRIRRVGVPEVEKLLYTWFLSEREHKHIINDQLLKIRALNIHKELKLNCHFTASQGFINNFKKRHGIRLKKIAGEKLSCADESTINDFKEKFKRKIAELNLVPEQIYNADETGLIYKNLGNRTLVTANEKSAPGRKNSKERITIMPCCNSTGSHKLKLMMIGKSAKPRIFMNWENILYYKSSKNAWQTTFLFKNWFFEQFVPCVKKNLQEKNLPERAILLLDNASCHGTNAVLQTEDCNFQVMFFPPNATAILQPLDQQIIQSMKLRYRKNLLMDLASKRGTDIVAKLKEINLKDVSIMIHQAWNDVPISVIQNAWKLLMDIDTTRYNLPANHVNNDADVSLALLYNNVLPDTILTNEQIMNWATGTTENLSYLEEFNLSAEESNENIDEDLDRNTSIDTNHNSIDEVINSFNIVLEWSEKENLPINDLLTLRKMRNKAVIMRVSK